MRVVMHLTMEKLDAERVALLDHLETMGGQVSARSAIEVAVGPWPASSAPPKAVATYAWPEISPSSPVDTSLGPKKTRIVNV